MKFRSLKIWMLFGVCFLLFTTGFSQENGIYIPDSSSMFIPANTAICLWGDTLKLKGSLLMEDSSSTIYFKGRAWKNDTSCILQGGRVVMNDTSLQSIVGMGSYGVGPAFRQLEIDNPGGVYLHGSNIRVENKLIFSKGVLLAGTNDIILSATATTLQTPTSFASVYEGGAISKLVSANTSFTFPVGSSYYGINYNPLKLDITAPSYGADSYVRVSVTDGANPNMSARHINHALKFWTVQFENLAADSTKYIGWFGPTDTFAGDTSKIYGSTFVNGTWEFVESGKQHAPLMAISGTLTGSGEIFGQDPLLQSRIKVYLQGAWNGSSMNTTLQAKNLLPLVQPYGSTPYNITSLNYTGSEQRTSFSPNVVDWVLVELRQTPTGAPITTSAGLLLSDGTIVDGYTNNPIEFTGAPGGDYYIVIKHRNHLSIMSSGPVSLPNSSTYDFTSAITNAYGTGQQMKPLSNGTYAMWGGNVNADNVVRTTGPIAISDYQKMLSILGNTNTILGNVYSPADVNLNGIVRVTGAASLSDYQILLGYLGTILVVNRPF